MGCTRLRRSANTMPARHSANTTHETATVPSIWEITDAEKASVLMATSHSHRVPSAALTGT